VSAPTTSFVDVDPVLPRIFDDLWAEHGPAIRAAQLAAVEAEADVLEAMGGPA
jgi:hypothetical protein